MPAYPCESCGAAIEIGGKEYDVRCTKCGERKPFKCSKCQKRLSVDLIFCPEKLTFRKPIFCEECGKLSEFVKCSQCKCTLMRANGVDRLVKGEVHSYHTECYDRAVSLQRKIFPFVSISLAIVCSYLLYNYAYSSLWVILGGIAIGAGLGYKISQLFGPK